MSSVSSLTHTHTHTHSLVMSISECEMNVVREEQMCVLQ